MRRRHSEGELHLSGPSHHRGEENKENECIVLDEDEDRASRSDLEGSDLSLKVHVDADDVFSSMILDVADFPEVVEQEDGYISPRDNSRGTEELSSPIWPGNRRQTRRSLVGISASRNPHNEAEDADFEAHVLSSPIYAKRREPNLRPLDEYETPVKWADSAGNETILAERTPTRTRQAHQGLDDVPSPILYRGPDLRSMLGVDCGSELDILCEAASGSSSTVPPTPSPETPGDSPQQVIDIDDPELDLDAEEQNRSEKTALRTKAVMDGWRRKWALPSLQAEKSSVNAPKVFALGSGALRAANLRRSETTVVMSDSILGGFYEPPKSAPSKISVPTAPKKGKLVFESTKVSSMAKPSKAAENVALCTDPTKILAAEPGDSEAELDIVYKARTKLSQYRLVLLICSARLVLIFFLQLFVTILLRSYIGQS